MSANLMAAIFDLNFEALPVIFELGIQRIWIQHPRIMLKRLKN